MLLLAWEDCDGCATCHCALETDSLRRECSHLQVAKVTF